MKTEIKLGMGLAALVVVIIVAFFLFGPSAPSDTESAATREPTPVENRRVAVRDVPLTTPTPPAPLATPPGASPADAPTAPSPAGVETPAVTAAPATQPAALPGMARVDIAPTTQPAATPAPSGLATVEPAAPAAGTPSTTEEPVDWRLLLAGATTPGGNAGAATPGRGPTPGMAPPGSVRPGSVGLPSLTSPTARSGPAGESPARGEAGTYTVRPGDTLSSISNNVYGSPNFWSKIAQANPNVNPNRLRVGQVLVIPPESEVRGSGRAEATSGERASGSALVRDPQREYQVVPGDSLSRISQQLYGTPNRWREIYELNRDAIGPSPTRLRVGMVLKLPAPPTVSR